MSKFEVYKSKDKDPHECYRWRLIDTNGQIIAQSGEAFWLKNIEPSIKTIQAQAPNSPVFRDESKEDIDKGYRFEYFKSEKDNQWYWRFKSGNNKILAVGEGYTLEGGVKKALENIKTEMGRAKIVNPFTEDISDRTDSTLPPGSFTWKSKAELEEQLKSMGVKCFDIYENDVYSEPIIVFWDCLKFGNDFKSIAFAFNQYPKLSPKMWCTHKNIEGAQSHPDYRVLELKNQHFHPFSIQLHNYNLKKILSLIETVESKLR